MGRCQNIKPKNNADLYAIPPGLFPFQDTGHTVQRSGFHHCTHAITHTPGHVSFFKARVLQYGRTISLSDAHRACACQCQKPLVDPCRCRKSWTLDTALSGHTFPSAGSCNKEQLGCTTDCTGQGLGAWYEIARERVWAHGTRLHGTEGLGAWYEIARDRGSGRMVRLICRLRDNLHAH